MGDEQYRSGGDFTLDFLGHRYGFSQEDFEERLATAAVRLGLAARPPRRDAERADLVELAVQGEIVDARSSLGRRLSVEEPPETLRLLVYWLRKLVFRSAWLDQRIKQGLVEARFDEATGSFHYHADGYSLPFDDDAELPVRRASQPGL